MSIPYFKYHPDPIGSGSIVESGVKCVCCGGQRGFIYTGPVFAKEKLTTSICPWCISDGSAHLRFDAEFSDAGGVSSYGQTPAVSKTIVEEVSYRTPGFSGWQQEHWVTCCRDAAAFLGRAGKRELESKWKLAVPSLMQEAGMTAEQWSHYVEVLDADGSPTAYVFQCLHCGRLLGYSDCD